MDQKYNKNQKNDFITQTNILIYKDLMPNFRSESVVSNVCTEKQDFRGKNAGND
jgi:hypothetical protein